jgi:hypothetical protein
MDYININHKNMYLCGILIPFTSFLCFTNQWPFQDPKLEVPTIYKAYFSGLCKGVYAQNMAEHGTNVPPSIGS